jgi:hypothetical protein
VLSDIVIAKAQILAGSGGDHAYYAARVDIAKSAVLPPA